MVYDFVPGILAGHFGLVDVIGAWSGKVQVVVVVGVVRREYEMR